MVMGLEQLAATAQAACTAEEGGVPFWAVGALLGAIGAPLITAIVSQTRRLTQVTDRLIEHQHECPLHGGGETHRAG